MAWYVVFCGRKPEVYDSWGVCSEYIVVSVVLLFRATRQGCRLRKIILFFLDHQDKLQKSKQVTQKAKDVTKKWCWKDWVILVQFIVIIVL
jgi:hypothetical protein